MKTTMSWRSAGIIGALALFSNLGVALVQTRTHPLIANRWVTWTKTSRHIEDGTHKARSSELHAQSNPLLELVKDLALGKKKEHGDIKSVQDFDAELASEIEEALLTAGVIGDKGKLEDSLDEDLGDITSVQSSDAELANGIEVALSTDSVVGGNANVDDAADVEANGSARQTPKLSMSLPITNREPQNVLELPPHTALAQVLANQYGIDLSSISPSSKSPGKKITAEDVEFHAWKISQPPSTPEALDLAYSLGLDLKDLYDDEELQLSDVQLFQENLRSLQMTSQIKKGTISPSKKAKKMRALDERMEQNMGKLSGIAQKLAGTVAESIAQQVQLPRQNTIFGTVGSKQSGDITSVGDFDAILASEIQDALASVDKVDEIKEAPMAQLKAENDTVDNGITESSHIEITDDIRDARENENGLSSATTAVEAIDTEFDEQKHELPTKEELQGMTCVQLKEELRLRGLKVSGVKSELVDRLFDSNVAADIKNEGVGNDGSNVSPLFFATLE